MRRAPASTDISPRNPIVPLTSSVHTPTPPHTKRSAPLPVARAGLAASGISRRHRQAAKRKGGGGGGGGGGKQQQPQQQQQQRGFGGHQAAGAGPRAAGGKHHHRHHEEQEDEDEEEWASDDEYGSDDDDDDDGLASSGGGAARHALRPDLLDAVVKVYCVHTEPNASLPWQRRRQFSSTSSGFVVSGLPAPERAGNSSSSGNSSSGTSDDAAVDPATTSLPPQRWILTNAHSVDHHVQVKVKRRGDDRKFLARVLSLGTDCDLALLTVDDDSFWQDINPCSFGSLPRLQDAVFCVGYPVGGESLSVTGGVVSRIETTQYTHGGGCELLSVTIDAAINAGNSGGPVFDRRGRCAGIAFQSLVGEDVQNTGYIIPTPVVRHFLVDYLRTGAYSGFPALGVQWQRMESDALRRAYGASDPLQRGVLVRGVNPTSLAAGLLRPDDVLLSFEGTPVAADGTVPFRTGERVAFSHLITSRFVGDEVSVEVLRRRGDVDGAAAASGAGGGGNGSAAAAPAAATPATTTTPTERLTLRLTLSRPQPLVPPHLNNQDPDYLVLGGLVFVSLHEPYLESEYGANYGTEAPVKLLDALLHGTPKSKGQQVVLLSQVLASDAALGYEDVENVPVFEVNGVKVHNLAHLAEVVAVACGCEADEVVSEGDGDGASAAAAAAAASSAAASATAPPPPPRAPGSSLSAPLPTPGPFLRFDVEYKEVVVVETRQAVGDTPGVLRQHGIPHALSPGLQRALEGSGRARAAAWWRALEQQQQQQQEAAQDAAAAAVLAPAAAA
jgi:S1-C subfamily serine protease